MTLTLATARINRCTTQLQPRNRIVSCKGSVGFPVVRIARPRLRMNTLTVGSTLKITEKATGVQFPLVRRFWEGDEFRCLGAAPRVRRVLFINAKVYAIALYVEAAKAAKELKIRDRGDFFKDEESSSFCDAIMDGAFNKVFEICMVRDVSSDQFVDAVEEAIGSKLRFIGASEVFEEFKTYMQAQELKKGNIVVFHWSVKGYMDVGVASKDVDNFATAIRGQKRFENVGFCRSMFELYMGNDTIIPEAKETWATGAKMLLESTKT